MYSNLLVFHLVARIICLGEIDKAEDIVMHIYPDGNPDFLLTRS